MAAYTDPAFRSLPASVTEVPFSGSITNMSSGVETALTLLRPGKYFCMAWHDTVSDRLHGANEPWGYYNWLGTPGKVAFEPRSLSVPVSGIPPAVTVVVEDIPRRWSP